MPLYLDGQTRPYLERLLKNVKETDFIGQRVIKALEADKARLEEMAVCEHEEIEMVGKKKCCGKCKGLFKPGHGEEWSRV